MSSAFAQESRATRTDAERMVRKGVEFLKKNGKEKAMKEITAPSRTFVDRDLYLVIYDTSGNCVAHGQNSRQAGMSLIDAKDADGKLFVKERVDLAKLQGKFWQDYKFTDPLSKKVLPKQMYCEKEGDMIVCGGVYKD
ncbi:MAG: cache domain-containing protein [Burkholderiales bacterium]|nr:cache domain-containing protein [Burkholderiales bacterium]